MWALRDISFDVGEGEVVGIIGPNGSGKTTLLKILARITKPSTGQVEIFGRVGSLLEVGTGFHPELSGRENIYLNGVILGMKKEEIDAKYDEIVAFSGVERFLEVPIKHYSSGMLVRLGFAVCAHLDAEIVLLDEVLAVGDAAFRKKSTAKVGDVAASGKTIVLVSHDLYTIRQLCTRVFLLDSGRIKCVGDPATVIAMYLGTNLGSIARGETIFDASKISQGVSLERLAIVNESGHVRPRISYNESFHLIVTLRVHQTVDKLYVAIWLMDEMDRLVFRVNTNDDPTPASKIGRRGKHSIGVQIPALLLAARNYSVQLRVISPDFGVHHLHKNAVGFEIGDSPLKTTPDEIIRPTFHWHVNSEEIPDSPSNGAMSEVSYFDGEPIRRVERIPPHAALLPQALSIRNATLSPLCSVDSEDHGGNQITVTTSPVPYSYALEIPIIEVDTGRRESEFYLRIQLRVLSGKIGVGALSRDRLTFVFERFFNASDSPSDLIVRLPSLELVSKIIFRNSLEHNSPSVMELDRVELHVAEPLMQAGKESE